MGTGSLSGGVRRPRLGIDQPSASPPPDLAPLGELSLLVQVYYAHGTFSPIQLILYM
jgi:hypothetical protein